VFYPSDAVSAERAVEMAANTKGICFIRTSRPATEVVYSNDHAFKIGKANVLRKSNTDKVLVIGAGVTLFEALSAADELKKAGVNIRVMDPFTIKPIDKEAIIENAKAVGGRIITVEDHYMEGLWQTWRIQITLLCIKIYLIDEISNLFVLRWFGRRCFGCCSRRNWNQSEKIGC